MGAIDYGDLIISLEVSSLFPSFESILVFESIFGLTTKLVAENDGSRREGKEEEEEGGDGAEDPPKVAKLQHSNEQLVIQFESVFEFQFEFIFVCVLVLTWLAMVYCLF